MLRGGCSQANKAADRQDTEANEQRDINGESHKEFRADCNESWTNLALHLSAWRWLRPSPFRNQEKSDVPSRSALFDALNSYAAALNIHC